MFAYSNAKTTESHRLNLLASTPWVTSESYQVSLRSRQAKLGSKQLILLPQYSTRVCAPSFYFCFGCLSPLASHLSSPSFIPSDPFQCRHALQSRHTKKAIVIQRLITRWFNCDSHHYNHSFYSLDEVIWLSIASTVYTPLRQVQANDIFLVKL